MEKLNSFIEEMNQKQKIAFGSVVSVGIFFIGFGFASAIRRHPFHHLDQTWFAWLLATAAIGFVWYKLLEDKDNKNA